MAYTIEQIQDMSRDEIARIAQSPSIRSEIIRDTGLLPCVCGNTLEKDGSYDIECDECLREYNCFGQMLAPREQWEESDEDDY